jgi:hypothetical protein
MNHKIKNFLTFGLYDRLVKTECELIKAKEASYSYYSELKRSIEKIDIDQAIDAAIDNSSILTDNNFSPSDYDLVSSNDYYFESFVDEDDVARVVESGMEDYRQKIDQDIRDNIGEMQGRFIKDTVKEICTEMLVDWCTRTAEAANKNKE